MKEYFTTMQAAIGDPEKMKDAKEKYKGYPEIPLMASFDRTIEFIANENKAKQQ
jgi:hypothetical protein